MLPSVPVSVGVMTGGVASVGAVTSKVYFPESEQFAAEQPAIVAVSVRVNPDAGPGGAVTSKFNVARAELSANDTVPVERVSRNTARLAAAVERN